MRWRSFFRLSSSAPAAHRPPPWGAQAEAALQLALEESKARPLSVSTRICVLVVALLYNLLAWHLDTVRLGFWG
jgi:hypothetical protein